MKKFCKDCGTKLVLSKFPKYDENTGKQIPVLCPKVGCPNHCYSYGGHKKKITIKRGFLFEYKEVTGCSVCGTEHFCRSSNVEECLFN